MLSKVLSCALVGIDAYVVEVEVNVAIKGLPSSTMASRTDLAFRESNNRVCTAIKNSGFKFNFKCIDINLTPANIIKSGSIFDLPSAIGIIIAEGLLAQSALDGFMLAGELSLDGHTKPFHGALSMAEKAKEVGFKGIILPYDNAREVAFVTGIAVYGARDLRGVVQFLKGEGELERHESDIGQLIRDGSHGAEDSFEVTERCFVNRALEIAAAGGHNILLIGPPGSGKAMLARRLVGMLPEIDCNEAIETTKVHSIAGHITPAKPLITTRPFRSPHHTISDAGLIGGGAVSKPGEVSLAHNGILFLGDLPEFHRTALEALQQPLDDHQVTLSMTMVAVSYPASFTLVVSMSPCSCGFHNDTVSECTCTPRQVQHYLAKVSGPLLDRIDMHVEVSLISSNVLVDKMKSETSTEIRGRVKKAKSLQVSRFGNDGVYCNSRMKPHQLKKYCQIDDTTHRLLENAMTQLGLSARAHNRILKIARTIADLDGSVNIQSHHVSEAVQYRSLDRRCI